MTYFIKENKEEDFVQVYEESDIYKGWKIVRQTYDIDKFNRMERHIYDRSYIYESN